MANFPIVFSSRSELYQCELLSHFSKEGSCCLPSIFCDLQVGPTSKHLRKTKSRSPALAFPFPKRPIGGGHLSGHLSTFPRWGEPSLSLSRQSIRGDHLVLPTAMPRRRGNPNWGQPFRRTPAGPTEFEREVHRLGLTRESCVDSSDLRRWCQRNKNRCYIPEWLLKKWGMDVDGDVYGAA